MRVLGIDPGYAIIGYGIVELRGNQLISIHYGHIATSAKNTYHERLLAINQELMTLLETWQPDALSIEKIFFAKNVKTAIDVAQVRGTLLLECLKKKMTVEEYTPNEVKLAVTGSGAADKSQVQKMVKSLLNLSEIPKPDDTADALAIAICHIHSAKIRNLR